MSKRNLVWLVAIVVVGAVAWITAGPLWGLVAAVATLLVSEVVERVVRARRRAVRGLAATSVRDGVEARRRRG